MMMLIGQTMMMGENLVGWRQKGMKSFAPRGSHRFGTTNGERKLKEELTHVHLKNGR